LNFNFDMKKKSILITGGAGFIGSRLALQLLARGHKIRVLDNLNPQIHGSDPGASASYKAIYGKLDFLLGNVNNREDLMFALSGIDTVVHMAAETGTGQSMYAIKNYSDVNVGGTALLLDIIANQRLPVSKIVVASSRAVYGEGKYHCNKHGSVYPKSRLNGDMEKGNFELHCPVCRMTIKAIATDEDSPVRPVSVYGITKLNQEQMVLAVAQSLGISAVALRYQNVYGPGQSLSNPYTGILSIFSTCIRNGSEINIFEDGTESRDFIYIDDVIEVTTNAIESKVQCVDFFNVGSGVSTDVLSIANSLQYHLGVKIPVHVTGAFRMGDIRHNFASLTKVRATFGFEAKVQIEDGLMRFAEWVKGEAIHIDRYEESLNELKVRGLIK